MADFSHLSNFDPNANFNMVRWSANSPMLEVELNEMQQILDKARADIVRQAVPSGVFDYNPYIQLGLDSTATNKGVIQVPTPNNAYGLTNGITITSFNANVNGYDINISAFFNATSSSLSRLGAWNVIQLDPPPSFGTRDDLVFLEVWFQEVGGANNSTGADTNVYQYGGVNSGTDANNILDGRINVETTHRVQLRWRIRVVDNVNFSKYPQLGIDNTTWNVLPYASLMDCPSPQGGNSSPITYSGAQSGNTPVATYGLYQAGLSGDTPTRANINDKGLFISGDGSSTAKTTLNTFDGYVYAIPLFRVKRRNNGGYRIDNPNGARDFYQLTCTATSTTITTVGQIYTLKVSDTSKVQVGDSFAWTVTFNSRFKVIQVVDSTTLTVQAISINSAVGDTQATGYVFNMLSDRPDGLFSNIIDASDIIDLRHQVSLTGFDRQLLLKSSFDKLMRAELQTNVKYTMQKEKYNLKRAPFGIAQALQPINVQGNDGVQRQLTNLLGTNGGFEYGAGTWSAVNTASTSVDSSVSRYGKQSLKVIDNNTNQESGATTNLFTIDNTKYYLLRADIFTPSNGNAYVRLYSSSWGMLKASPATPGNGGWTTAYVPISPTDLGTNTSVQIVAVVGQIAGTAVTTWIDGVSLYQIDQATYNSINTAQTGFATASDIQAKFPYVDSYPNFAENLIPDFTQWNTSSLSNGVTLGSPYSMTFTATNQYQNTYVTIPVTGSTTYQFTGLVSNAVYVRVDFLDSNGNTISKLDPVTTVSPINGPFTTPSNCVTAKIYVMDIRSSGWTPITVTNFQIEKVNTGISYPNPFVPTGRWFLQQDQFNPQLGGQQTILHNQNTLGGAFNGLRSNFSNAQISQTVVDVVESNGYSAQKHIVATQATKGQWATNDTVKINNYYGVLDGVYASGDVSRITTASSGTNLVLTVDDVTKFAVNDTVNIWPSSLSAPTYTGLTITAIDTTNNKITLNNSSWFSASSGDLVILTTTSKASPTVVDSAGNTIAGTWSGLGTKTATFTVTTPPATNTSNLTITYSVSYPTGQGFNYLPLSSSDVLQASVNGDVLHSANTISVKANFNGKVSGNTDLNPHFSGAATNSASLLVPSSFGEATASVYPLLSQLDGSSYSFSSSTSGNYAQALYKFNLIRAIEDKFGEIPADGTANKATWIRNNLSNLVINWYGYGSSVNGNKATLTAYRINTNDYQPNWQTNIANSPSLLSGSLVPASTYSNFIDSNGMVNFLAYADPAGNVANPTVAPTLSASGSGSGLSAGTYYVVYTYKTANGETQVSPEASITITAGQNINVAVASLPFGVTQANIYISTTTGTETYQGYTTTPTSYNQTTALLTGQPSAPSSNTAVVSSTIYTDYVELQITLNTAETGFTVLQPDNPFPSLSNNLMNRHMANLIDPSMFSGVSDGAYNDHLPTFSLSTDYVKNSPQSLKVVADGVRSYQGVTTNALGTVNLNAGVTYTVSALVYCTQAMTSLRLVLLGGGVTPQTSMATTVGWNLISVTYTPTQSTAGSFTPRIDTGQTAIATTYYINYIKAEVGPVATPWTPGRNKNFTLNFLGKVAGSTAENPNKYYYNYGATFPTPPSGFIETFSNSIQTLDGVIAGINATTSGNYAQQMFEFDLSHLGMSLTELKNALRSLTVNWTGYGSGDSTYVPAPTTAPTLSTATTGGNLAPGTYYVVYTWKTSSGETMASPEQSIVVPSGTSTNTITANIPGLPTNVTSANIYISTTSGAEKLQGNTATSSYTQTAVLATATALPTSNTTGGTLTNGAVMSPWDSSSQIWGGNTYALYGTNTGSSPSLVSGSGGSGTTVHITNNQKVYILVRSTYPASATNPSNIYTDYISLQVTLADYVDYAKSNIVKVRPSTMEIKTLFPAKSNRYTGFSGIAQEDVVDLWYKHVPVYSALPSNGGTNVTVLAESDDWLVSDIGSNMGAVQGTHPYQNPLYRVGNDRMTTFAQYGFARVSWQEDSREINTGAQTSLYLNGVYAYGTVQSALNVVSKPLVAIARWLVLTPSGELQLAVLSTYATNGAIGTVGNLSTVVLLIPIQGRPLVKDPQGIQRGYMNPKTWLTKESTILV